MVYLQKFISLETKIPKRIEDGISNDVNKYCKKLMALHELETLDKDNFIIRCLIPLANHFNFSLRQLEKVYTNLTLLYGSTAHDGMKIEPIFVFLSIVKVLNPKIFDDLLHKKISYHELCIELDLTNIEEDEVWKNGLTLTMSWVRFCLISEQEFFELPRQHEIKTYLRLNQLRHIHREELIPIFARQLNLFVVN